MTTLSTVPLSQLKGLRAFATLLVAAVTAIIILAPSAGAASVVSSSPARGNVSVAPGDTFKLTITTDKDPAIAELEVDHNMSLPEFSLSANAADPYDGSAANFAALGMTVIYNPSAGQWVLDFGQTVTQAMISQGTVRFHFVLKDASGASIWGSMSPITPENTFTYTIARGTAPVQPEENDDVVIPGVPNTANDTNVWRENGFLLAGAAAAAGVLAVVVYIVRRG